MQGDAQEHAVVEPRDAGQVSAGARLAAAALRHRLARAGRARLRMRGGSMRPLLPDGSWIELRPAAPGENLVGQIVAVDAGDLVVVHRVTRARDGWIETRGIASRAPDPPRPRQAVIGVADTRWLRPLAASCAAAMRVRALLRRRAA